MKEDIFEYIADIDDELMTEEEINNEKIKKYPKLLNKYYELLQEYKKCKGDNINKDEDVVLEIEYLNNIEDEIQELYEKNIIIECIMGDKQKESYCIRNKIEQLKIKMAKIQNKP